MTTRTKPKLYRDLIDRLVDMCHNGQGQICPDAVRAGVWNANATAKLFPDQHKINLLLARLDAKDRGLIAGMLAESVACGVFETLKALEEFKVEPFQDGYEGSPYNDFIGRLSTEWKWEWPKPTSKRPRKRTKR